MKKKTIILMIPLLIFTLVASGCERGSESLSDNSRPTLGSEEPTSTTTTSTTSTTITSTEGRTGQKELSFYATNDFHGSIVETNSEPGIFKLGSYLKSEFAAKRNKTVYVDAGDIWQGSADSNINRGKFLVEAMNVLKLDAQTIGNHEFDWYDTVIETNKELANYPFLGANIMVRETGELATNLVSYDETFKASTMVTRNDVNIGIIGTIGMLEGSILAGAIAPYTFKPVTTYIEREAENLRAQGADMIVLSTHDSLANSLGAYAPIIENKVVDIIFSGHHHVRDNQFINDVPIMQTEGNGKQVMEVHGYYDFNLKEFKVTSREFTEAADIKRDYTEDTELLNLFNEKYAEEIERVKGEVIGSLTNYINKSTLVKLANKVMYNFASITHNPDTIIAVHNYGGVRVDGIDAGEVTYGDIYKAFPFDNEIKIFEDVLGSTASSFIDSNVSYPIGKFDIQNDQEYTIVTIDYVSDKKNSNIRDYPHTVTGEYVRELIAEYFRTNGEIDPYTI
jgi:2',3'-cyclic-nucleotide 2'-phosphodiesterase (5'-nucleotidase family)